MLLETSIYLEKMTYSLQTIKYWSLLDNIFYYKLESNKLYFFGCTLLRKIFSLLK